MSKKMYIKFNKIKQKEGVSMTEQQKLKRASYNMYTFVVSKMVSTLGTTVYSFAVSMYILAHTGSALAFAINLILSIVPRVVMSPIAGVLADRMSKKMLVVGAQIGIVLTLAVVLAYTSIIGLSLLVLYVTTVFFQLFGALISIGFTAAIPNLVDEERIQRAMSLNQMMTSVASIGGPIVGGILFGFASFEVFFIIMLVTMMVEVILDMTMHFTLYHQPHVAEEENTSMMQSLKEGWAYVQRNEALRKVFVMVTLINFFFSSFSVGSNFIFLEKLAILPKHIGWIESCIAIGTIMMSAYMATRKKFQNPLAVSKLGLFGLSSLMIFMVIPLMTSYVYTFNVSYYAVLMLLFGAFVIITNMPMGVWSQQTIEEGYRGRVFGLLEMMAMAMMPAGTLLYGVLFDIVSPVILFGVSGCCLIILTFILMPRRLLQLAMTPRLHE